MGNHTQKHPFSRGQLSKNFLTCLCLPLAKLAMSFLVASVAEAHKISDIQPTFRSLRDRDDVMDFGSRLNDVLFIAILTQRMIVAVSFGELSPLRVIPFSMTL